MGKAQLEQLERHGMYLSVPRGTSMLPMLRSKRDVVEIHRLERPAKRCDLVLYVRGEEQQGVLHRVIAVREKSKNHPQIVEASANAGEAPAYLEVDRDKLCGKLVSVPMRDQISAPIDEQLVVEFYSR